MNSKGFSPLTIIIGVSLVLVIAGGIYYFSNSKILFNQNRKLNSHPSSSPITPQRDTSVEWKIYQGKEFSIEYPATFYLKQLGEGIDFIGDSKDSTEQVLNNQPMKDDQILITLMVLPEVYESDQAMLERLKSLSVGESITLVSIGPRQITGARKITDNKPFKIISYFFRTKESLILIYAQTKSESNFEIFEQMIGTLNIKN